jgi:Tol biopolymer transport system component
MVGPVRSAGSIALAASVLLSLAACGSPPAPAVPAPPPAAVIARADEVHLADVRQLTFGGENAEAYWSWAGDQLILQARSATASCDRIGRLDPFSAAAVFTPVSSGKGATTCSFFLPGDKEVIYASTHLGGDACPPRPDHSKGYVWALYPDYDIFRGSADGTGPLTRLTDTPGYDAEGTVCGKDGSIVFTSVRDGDIDLYRMDADGKNVRRLTDTPGYDGGAFFNADCTKIVWRASRPKGKDLEDFKALLAQNLVRPTKLELYVANADGSDPVQITYLDAASFAPYWHPSQKRILFSTNYAASSAREFDVWGVNVDGTGLERVTTADGFDGFPMFSPDGRWLALSSNRATAPGQHDTNVFLARRRPPIAS